MATRGRRRIQIPAAHLCLMTSRSGILVLADAGPWEEGLDAVTGNVGILARWQRERALLTRSR
ncbi:hypothetical protein E2562_002893 [Oryza meyeriana var. granulata]|uniref:Uncharacterized protein n=1 Tax=Oryza meyeriana var. granulata TaxID=110450 RepID=A0A6G1DCS3_9ORYZ|nr:hypothetical protein E2562_002893 [Oryza meyeriana var. granulata]